MSILNVLTYPDKFLKKVAKPVTIFDQALAKLAEDMIETMYDAPGVGLAATQVGEDKRMFVMDVFYNRDDPDSVKEPIVVINPKLTDKKGDSFAEEGCLSVPGFRAEVSRASELTLKYQDLEGNHCQLDVEGFQAICVQHENDHLDGKLFIDYLPPLKRKIVQNKLKKGIPIE